MRTAYHSHRLFFVACMCGLMVAQGCGAEGEDPVQKALAQQLADSTLSRTLADFYAKRNYAPYWLENDQPHEDIRRLKTWLYTEQWAEGDETTARALVRQMADWDEQIAHIYQEETKRDTIHAQAIAALEVALSETVLSQTDRITQARIHPRSISVDTLWPWTLTYTPPASFPVLETLTEQGLDKTIAALEAKMPGYTALREAVQRYTQIAANGGWEDLGPLAEKIEPGAQHPVVPKLRKRLGLTFSEDSLYDASVVAAVKQFQTRHGLYADGVLGRETIAALQVPVEERLWQLRVNVERHRWLAQQFPERYLLVNLPAYRLFAFDEGKLAFDMEAIIGTTRLPTPMLADTLHSLAFSPYWYVPAEIAINEMLPKIALDSFYLEDREYELIYPRGEDLSIELTAENLDARRVVIRQRSGPLNALGRVKFLLQNDRNIYLHDSPARSLFGRDRRAMSHGCVRLSNPARLAEFLLAPNSDKEWTPDLIDESMESETEFYVSLAFPVPVYFIYLTAWVAEDGQIHFRNDIYGQDHRLAEALGLSPPPTPSAGRNAPPV